MQSAPHRRSDHVVAAGVVLLAGALYLVLRGPLGEAASAISILPVAIISTIYGTRPGLLAAAIAFPFNTFVLEALFDDDPVGITPVSSLISISLFGIAWLFGRFHALRNRLTLEAHEHHRAEEALRISEERLRGFLNATPDVIFRLGPTGRLLELHGEHNLVVDLKKEELLYRNLDEFFPKEAVTEILREAALARNGTKRTFNVPLPFGGQERLMQISLAPGGDRDVVAIARDVTEIAAAEEERNLIELLRAKDEFVAGVAHELRTPLSGILGFAATLRDHPDPISESEENELIAMIADQSQELAHRIDDLIVAARADVGRLEVITGPVSLDECVRATVAKWPEGVQVEMTLQPTMAVADAQRVMHILQNLLNNAIDHGGAGIRIETGIEQGSAVARVIDDGSGIAHPSPGLVFRSYSAEAQSASQPTRIGIGLTVAKQLARLMDGDITYQRRDGMSVFELSLPRGP